MFAATKILHASHVIAAKALTGKAIVSAGVVASTLATGYVAKSGVPPEYVNGAAVLIDAAALAEASQTDGERAARAAANAADANARAQVDPALPGLEVRAQRMDWRQKARYDAQKQAATQLAEK